MAEKTTCCGYASQRDTHVREKAREMLGKLWRGRGGFIAGYYSDNASIGLDPRWQDYACDEFISAGVTANYKIGLSSEPSVPGDA